MAEFPAAGWGESVHSAFAFASASAWLAGPSFCYGSVSEMFSLRVRVKYSLAVCDNHWVDEVQERRVAGFYLL